MAKKIAAPAKTTRKAPAAKKASAKKITAPKTHKPSGSPKEKLAYLNKGEMAALSKRKGSGPVRGPKGLPSFVETSGTKSAGSISDGYKKSGGSWNSSSATRSSGASGGSYNSGTSGSRGGGASTQAPGMGRNEGRVGPVSPMGGQGASFATNKAARDDTLRRAYGIEDKRGLQNMPQRPYFDNKLERTVNPNLPPVDLEKHFQEQRAYEDRVNREQAALTAGRYRNPQEIRSISDRLEDVYDKQDVDAAITRKGLQKSAPLSQDKFRANVARGAASDRLPDIKIGGPRSGVKDGYSGGGMGGTYTGGGYYGSDYRAGKGAGGWKAGGLVKKSQSRKTFKKK